jgi:hypothetical protein
MSHDRLYDESVAFLQRDYEQLSQEKRRYEDASWDVCKFTFTAYATIAAAAVGVYQYSQTERLNLVPVGIVLLSLGAALGILMYVTLLRMRVYFVIAARYINSVRALYLSQRPLGFDKMAQIYVSDSVPPYYSWASVQTWSTCVVAILNAASIGGAVYFARGTFYVSGVVTVLMFVVQALVGVIYLRSREGRSAEHAAFGIGTAQDGPPPSASVTRKSLKP